MRVPFVGLPLLVVTCLLVGCSKNVDTRVAGDDDAAIDGASARLEELRARAAQDDLSCQDRCEVANQTCGVAEEQCSLVDRNPDRDDLPPRCAQGREQCSSARDSCASCQNG
ncbi:MULTISPECIES: hypothetical protein [Myxococcus]|uniref:hypothetical protein n=1 Tax=Myxococcus TaxID=32 RepID=UPI00157AD5B8|nr:MULTISPECIES: hypothetical protein [Myxococcus]NTX01533.1 hypothetical protein [Myxococcus sp. CA040A]NTX40088.1 hypothetical protein [Myxococcus sp. CA033]NTX52277.1 hypothetical protein [Myxococcus sp. CA039A]